MAYYDIMVIPVPKTKLVAYKKMLRGSVAAWKRCGASAYMEAVGEGLKPGKLTSFPQSVKARKGEVVVCAMLTFKNKAHRTKAWKLIMKDPFMTGFDHKKAPFDMKRMFFGGFKHLNGF